MKKLIVLFFFLLGSYAFSQTAAAAKEVFEKIKKEAVTDGSDTTVYNVLDEFYAQNLQADNDEITPETVEKIQRLASDPHTKNLHLLLLFLGLLLDHRKRPFDPAQQIADIAHSWLLRW